MMASVIASGTSIADDIVDIVVLRLGEHGQTRGRDGGGIEYGGRNVVGPGTDGLL